MAEPTGKFTILIVDDSEEILALLETMLCKEYHVKRAVDGRTALRVAFEKPRPDLILLDVEMPGSSGYDVCRAIKASPALADIPVIFLTAHDEIQDVVHGFQLGAIDYYTKPINGLVLRSRIQAHVELIARRSQQEELIRLRTAQLEQTRLQLIRRLGRAMEYHETSAVGNRVVRLGHYARHLAQAAGAKPELCELIMKAAPLHDIGKLGVPAQILRKSEKLTAPEREQIQRHAEIGAEIIGEHDDPLLKLARMLALTHHERWDGSGYPSGASGNQIPWPGRVMAVVDAFEGMTATQFHHAPMPLELAVAEIVRGSGKQFDPRMVEAFGKALPAFRKVLETYADSLGDMLDLDFASMPLPPQVAAAVAAVTAQDAAEARTVQSMREADEMGARALASVRAQLEVERDLTAAAIKDASTQQAARKRPEEAGARGAEALELSKRRMAEDAAAARAAQERMQAEAEAATVARQAERVKAQALAVAQARIAAEQALAAAAADRKKAEDALAKTAADLGAAEIRAAETARKHAAEEAAARGALQARVKAEETAAQLAQQAAQAKEQLLVEIETRAKAEQTLAAAAAEKCKAEEAAAKAATAIAAAEQEKAAAAKQRAADEASAKAAVENRLKAEAEGAIAVKEADVLTAQALADTRAIADLRARLKVERDLTAAAEKEAAAQRSNQALAQDRAARETEVLEAAKRRLATEATATRLAQERAQAEEAAAETAQRKARELADLETSAAEQAKARFEAEAKAVEAEKCRADQEAAARQSAQERAGAEARLAAAARELEQAKANALAQVQARIQSEQALAAATQEKLQAEESARRKAEEVAAAEAEAIEVAKRRTQAQAQLAEAARTRLAAEAGVTKLIGERAAFESTQGAKTPSEAKPDTAPPRRHTTRRTLAYAATLVAVAAVAFYSELLFFPQPAGQLAPPPISAHAPTPIFAHAPPPIPWLSEGAPIELRLDVAFEKLAPRERPN